MKYIEEITYRPEEELSDKLLFAANFNQQDLTAIAGKAEAGGDITYVKSDDGTYAIQLDGTNYLTLTNADGSSLLAGKDEITISFHKLAEAASRWLYAAPDESVSDQIIGISDTGSNLIVERWDGDDIGTSTNLACPYTPGDWQEITLVIAKERSQLR